jgi:riboflavin biosynthesis pyrimidine reductase
VKALLPSSARDVDLVVAYALPGRRRSDVPFLRCNMISTIDGAISVQGRSGLLGGPADRRVFQTLRCLTDVVLVGAGTMRAENYGPVRLDDDLRAHRTAAGRPPVPPIAVVTGSGNFDWSSPFFAEAEARPIVFVPDAAVHDVRTRAGDAAEVVGAGDGRVEPRRVLEHLGAAGFGSVLLEGGPGLNAENVRAGLLDELCLTVSPCLVAGSGPRVLAGPELERPLELEVVHLLEEDGFLFYRLCPTRSSFTGAGGRMPGTTPGR